MVEIGVSGPPFRASVLAAGAAVGAEADGAHAIWYADDPGIVVSPDRWRTEAGPMARVVPDPSDIADPALTATVAALLTRRLRVGLLGWDPGSDPAHAARVIATLADIAPGRHAVAVGGSDADAIAFAGALRPALDIELARYGADPVVAAAQGWGWIGVAMSADLIEKLALDAKVTGTVGVHLPVVVHNDAGVARAALDAPLLRSFGVGDLGDGIVVGGMADLDASIDRYVESGVSRIVLENLLPYGAPEELEASQAALRTCIRSARLRHRGAS